MKIALYTDTFYPQINGVATSCLNLSRALRQRGHEVHVYAPRCKGWKQYADQYTHFVPSLPLVFLKDRNLAFWGVGSVKEAMEQHFDVIHTNSEFNMGFMGRTVALKNKVPLVHTYHTIWEDYTYYITHGKGDKAAQGIVRKYSKWWCNHFNRTITPTEKCAELLRKYGVSSPIDVIPSGMDLARFSPERHSKEQIDTIRKECGVKPGERVLLNIGRIASEKNIEQLMRVFPRLHEKCPDVRLVIIGEGPLRSELGVMAERLGVADHVSIPGPKPWERIDSYYAIGDVFASCSHSETQGLTYIEAMASGLCLCAVNDACLDGVVEHGVNGLLSSDDDDNLLEMLIRGFSEEGAEIRGRAIAAAASFSTEVFAERVQQCYLKAIGGKE